ncbi:Cytosolic enolase 3 [Bienertia sinuspersici]
MSVQEYLDKHALSRKIEDAVNAAVRAKTNDPVLFIANHMFKAVKSMITKVKARQILDSRGIPTVEVELSTNKGTFRASAPSGPSSGLYEAIELRDGDKGIYLGNSVNKAVRNINEKISEALIGMDPTLQSQIDQVMLDLDKTEKKVIIAYVEVFFECNLSQHLSYHIDLWKRQTGELGANAILAVSIAACKAGAAEKEALHLHLNMIAFKIHNFVPLYKHIADISGGTNTLLPVPFFTVLSGGKHAGNNLAIREIMILPVGAKTYEEAVQMGAETYHHLKAVITEKYGVHGCNVGEEGGLAPNVSRQVHLSFALYSPSTLTEMNVKEALDLVMEAIGRTGHNEKIKIAIDVAATEFCIGTKYDLDFKNPNKSGQNFKTGEDMIEMYKQLCADYPIVSIGDPFDKEDWEHTKYFSSLQLCQVAGDGLLMSSPKRIEKAIQESTCNALLLKINQIGTVTEAIEAVKMAKDAHWGVMVAHRTGETEDTFIADLAVGLVTGQFKAGAPCRGERLCKYNQVSCCFGLKQNLVTKPTMLVKDGEFHDHLESVPDQQIVFGPDSENI